MDAQAVGEHEDQPPQSHTAEKEDALNVTECKVKSAKVCLQPAPVQQAVILRSYFTAVCVRTIGLNHSKQYHSI